MLLGEPLWCLDLIAWEYPIPPANPNLSWLLPNKDALLPPLRIMLSPVPDPPDPALYVSKAPHGVVIPIPTLPVDVILIFSLAAPASKIRHIPAWRVETYPLRPSETTVILVVPLVPTSKPW